MSSAKILPILLVASSAAFAAAKSEDRVWIARSDGSRQCEDAVEGRAHDRVAEAKAELTRKGVHVIEAKKDNDGRVHAQACGISTGNLTTFLIPKRELAKAKALGFEEVR